MLKTEKIDRALIAGLLLAVLLTGAVSLIKDCRAVEGAVLRLHILANSDSALDQEHKLLVRDAVLRETGELFAGAGSRKDAIARARQALPAIEKTAEETLLAAGDYHSVTASVVRMHFPARTYGTRTLPPGMYDALRIEIGEAAGHNWWCVLFPPLCVGAAADRVELRLIDDLNARPDYKLAFAAAELFQRLFGQD